MNRPVAIDQAREKTGEAVGKTGDALKEAGAKAKRGRNRGGRQKDDKKATLIKAAPQTSRRIVRIRSSKPLRFQ